MRNRIGIIVIIISLVFTTVQPVEVVQASSYEEVFVSNAGLLQCGEMLPAEDVGTSLYVDSLGASYSESTYEKVETAITGAYDKYATTVNLSKYNISSDSIKDIITRILNNHPEFFYVDNAFSYSLSMGRVVNLNIVYMDLTNIDSRREAYAQEKQKVVSMVNSTWSDFEKVIFLHDYLGRYCEYDSTYSRYSAYDALVDKVAVCQGYSLAFIDLCRTLNIDAGIVTSVSLNHAWNYVAINDCYYFLDITWDDPLADRFGRIQHTYLLKSAKFMRDSANEHFSENDWGYSSPDFSYSLASDVQYDTYLWDNVSSGFEWINGYWYCVNGSTQNLERYTCNGETLTYVADVMDVSDYWKVVGSASQSYVGNFASIASCQNKLFCSKSKELYQIDMDTEESTLIRTLTASEIETGYIYGIRIDTPGELIFQIGETPSSKGLFLKCAFDYEEVIEEPSTEEINTEETSTEGLNTEEVSTEKPGTEEPTTEEPTTEEPTTEEPSTEEPTTEEPTTEEPTTEEPTTEEPTTEEPTTEEPTTEEPTTEEPTTEEPTTEEPTTEEPTTEEPTTEEPTTEEPTTENPSTEEPNTEEPSTEKPDTVEPSTEEPSTEKPSTEETGTEKPDTEEPSTEKPDTEEPGTEKPDTVEPGTEGPSTDESDGEKPSTEEPTTEEPTTDESDGEKPSTEEPSTEESTTEKPDTEGPDTENPSTGDDNSDGSGETSDPVDEEAQEKIPFEIVFDGNGSTSGSMENYKAVFGELFSVPANQYKKTGYTFVAWIVNLGDKTVLFSPEQPCLITSGGDIITFTAYWKPNEYMIQYHLNGGQNSTSNPGKYSVADQIQFAAPFRKGYTFEGWYWDSNFQNKVTDGAATYTGDIHLYAKWKIRTYKITYKTNKGKLKSSAVKKYKITTKTFTLKKPTRKGYKFRGWYTSPKYKKKVTKIKKGTTGNITLYARWKKIT